MYTPPNIFLGLGSIQQVMSVKVALYTWKYMHPSMPSSYSPIRSNYPELSPNTLHYLHNRLTSSLAPFCLLYLLSGASGGTPVQKHAPPGPSLSTSGPLNQYHWIHEISRTNRHPAETKILALEFTKDLVWWVKWRRYACSTRVQYTLDIRIRIGRTMQSCGTVVMCKPYR
ncbi:hypothetical protein BGX38DRAFT_1142457 [Terfezia claveryi]|nr:hypothetical protein BGX38DRAFT_1142457 [Terfezia claveryi]